jgi:very-short-patch-repair endonuclease
LDIIRGLGESPTSSNVIEPINEVPDVEGEEEQTNIWEKRLEQRITEDWGFSGFSAQEKIELPDIGGWTKPDLVHEDGRIAVYLDGPHHEDSEQRQEDRMLRNTLRNKEDGWTVIEIPIQDAENDQMMNMYRQQISRNLSS